MPNGNELLKYAFAGLIFVAILIGAPAGVVFLVHSYKPPQTSHNQNTGTKPSKQPSDQSAIKEPPAVNMSRAKVRGIEHDRKGQAAPSHQKDKDYGGLWRFWIGFVDYIGRQFSGQGDTLAQWLMALFSAFATGISIWAVFLLKDTLAATRRANALSLRNAQAAETAVEITREASENELRAYVYFENATLVHLKVTRE